MKILKHDVVGGDDDDNNNNVINNDDANNDVINDFDDKHLNILSHLYIIISF